MADKSPYMLRLLWELDPTILDMRKAIEEEAAKRYCTKLFVLTTYDERAKLYAIKAVFEMKGFTVYITRDDIFNYVAITIDWRLRRMPLPTITS